MPPVCRTARQTFARWWICRSHKNSALDMSIHGITAHGIQTIRILHCPNKHKKNAALVCSGMDLQSLWLYALLTTHPRNTNKEGFQGGFSSLHYCALMQICKQRQEHWETPTFQESQNVSACSQCSVYILSEFSKYVHWRWEHMTKTEQEHAVQPIQQSYPTHSLHTQVRALHCSKMQWSSTVCRPSSGTIKECITQD